MKKLLLLVYSLFLFTGLMFAQEESEEVVERTSLRVGVLNGPSCVPVAYLMENSDCIENTDLSFQNFADPQALLPKLLKNEVDIGFMPVNVAAKVYNSSNKSIICAGVCGNGNLSLITKDPSIKKITDLEEKTVYVAGQGATPEYLFRYILKQHDLEAKVELNFNIAASALPASVIADKVEYAVVPEPFATIATTKDNKIFYAIDLQREYKILTGSETYPLTCIVVSAKYAKEHVDTVKAFLNEYALAVDWTIENPAMAGKYCENHKLGLAMGIVKKSVPKANYVFIPATEAKPQIEELLNIFMSFDSKAVGEKLPEQDFYLK